MRPAPPSFATMVDASVASSGTSHCCPEWPCVGYDDSRINHQSTLIPWRLTSNSGSREPDTSFNIPLFSIEL